MTQNPLNPRITVRRFLRYCYKINVLFLLGNLYAWLLKTDFSKHYSIEHEKEHSLTVSPVSQRNERQTYASCLTIRTKRVAKSCKLGRIADTRRRRRSGWAAMEKESERR